MSFYTRGDGIEVSVFTQGGLISSGNFDLLFLTIWQIFRIWLGAIKYFHAWCDIWNSNIDKVIIMDNDVVISSPRFRIM